MGDVGCIENMPFYKLLNIKIKKIGRGMVELEMPITEHNSSFQGMAHCGALMSLAEMAMEMACASLGYRTNIMSMATNFVRPVSQPLIVSILAIVVHADEHKIVAEGRLLDIEGFLTLQTSGTFCVLG